MRLRLLGAALCALGWITLSSTQVMAVPQAGPTIPSYTSDLRVDEDGQLEVSEVWKLTGASGTFSRFFVTREHLPDDVDHVQQISDVEAKVGGATKQASVKTDGDLTSVAVGDVSGDVELTMTYTVRGAVSDTVNGTELHWSPLTGLQSEVQEVTVRLQTPETTHIQCTAGELNGNAPCTLAQLGETSMPEFQQFALAPGNTLRISVGFKPDSIAANAIVEYRKSFKRSFTADGPRLGAALGLLVLGGAALYMLYRTRGRDKIDPRRVVPASLFSLGSDTRIAFTPPENLRPGQVGTLIDERIDPVDVTASIFDLAVRGHLSMTELPKASEFARPDWELRRHDGPDSLRPYEKGLLKALFGDSDTVLVSKLGPQVRAHLGDVQNALYDDVVDRGWFAERPDKTRSKWSTLGIAVLVLGIGLTVLLALTSRWGLLGIAVALLGGGLIYLGRHMPSKTPAAGKVLGQMAAIRGELLEMDVSELPRDQHTELCSRALPYAVVLGGADRWIDALVETDTDDTTPDEGFPWYRGPDNWHLQHLPDSLRNLTTNLTGALFAR